MKKPLLGVVALLSYSIYNFRFDLFLSRTIKPIVNIFTQPNRNRMVALNFRPKIVIDENKSVTFLHTLALF